MFCFVFSCKGFDFASSNRGPQEAVLICGHSRASVGDHVRRVAPPSLRDGGTPTPTAIVTRNSSESQQSWLHRHQTEVLRSRRSLSDVTCCCCDVNAFVDYSLLLRNNEQTTRVEPLYSICCVSINKKSCTSSSCFVQATSSSWLIPSISSVHFFRALYSVHFNPSQIMYDGAKWFNRLLNHWLQTTLFWNEYSLRYWCNVMYLYCKSCTNLNIYRTVIKTD